MVLLPDTGQIQWQQHTHTSGRIYLSNPATNETRWLWRKWDSNGRIFVENISNPSQRLWSDQMDLKMRLQSGTATPQEVQQFQMYGLQQPPPPPFLPNSQHQHQNSPFNPQNRISYQRQQPSHQQNYPLHQNHHHPPFPLRSHPTPNRDDSFRNHNRPAPLIPHLSQPNHFKQNEKRIDHSFQKRNEPVHSANRYWDQHNKSTNHSNKRQKLENKSSNKQAKRPPSRFLSQVDDHLNNQSDSNIFRPSPLLPNREQLDQFYSSKRQVPISLSKCARAFLEVSASGANQPLTAYIYRKDFALSKEQKDSHSEATFADDTEEDYNFEPVIGTCQKIEKEYLRLTSAPKAEAVRPPIILKQTVEHIKQSWKTNQKDYDWVCRQLKSVRQDYKVQHIENDDVVHAYETHARLALENNDLGEFNTCVAQLQELFHKVKVAQNIMDEFSAYRILYNLLVGASEWEQGKILANFSSTERNRNATKFALQIRKAIITGNYRKYFQLCFNPPSNTMISYLLVHFHDRVRSRAIAAMTAAYGPGQPALLPLRFVFDQLAWSPPTNTDDQHVPLESVVSSSNTELLKSIRSLNIYSQSIWILKAIIFLFNVNCVLITDKNDASNVLDRVMLDFKATKAAGVKLITSARKLITHAGSEVGAVSV